MCKRINAYFTIDVLSWVYLLLEINIEVLYYRRRGLFNLLTIDAEEPEQDEAWSLRVAEQQEQGFPKFQS